MFRDIDNSLMTLLVQTTLLFSRVLNYMNYFECLSTQITKHSHPSEELYRTITHQATLTQSFEHSSNARPATDLTHNCCLSFVLQQHEKRCLVQVVSLLHVLVANVIVSNSCHIAKQGHPFLNLR